MLPRASLFLALVPLALAAGAEAQSALPDSGPAIGPAKPELFNRIIANQKKGEAALDLYERLERVETRRNANDPAPLTTKTARVIPSGTGMVKIPVGADGRPADSAAYRTALEGLAHALALLDAGTQRDAVQKYEKKRKERNDLIDATHNAFLFTFLENEPRNDRILAKYKMVPNPAFKPTTRFTSIFPKVRGFVWVDPTSGELARIEGEVTDDISVGLFLGKIYKGSHFMQERYEFQPGLWMASFSQYDFDGRKLFSAFSIHERSFFSNYKYIGTPKEALATIRQELNTAQGTAQDSAGEARKRKKVYTNDDVGRSKSAISVVGDPKNMPKPTKSPNTAGNSQYVASVRKQLDKLQEQIADIDKQLTDLKNFSSGEPSTNASGVKLNKSYEREPIEVQMRALLEKKKHLESKMDELLDEARKKGVDSSQLR